MAVDQWTKSLLHFDGTNGSTTFTDDTGITWTAHGSAQISTAQSVFGGASGLFNGTTDYIDTPDSDDWQIDGGSDSNKWTIDFRVRFASVASGSGLVSQHQDNNNQWHIDWGQAANTLRVFVRNASANTVVVGVTWTPSVNTWYHVAIVKDGTNGYMFFVDGTQVGTTQTNTNTIPNFSATLRVGVAAISNGTNFFLNGWMDEFRLSKGISRWTSNFTPPAAAYSNPTKSISGAISSIVGALSKLTSRLLIGAISSIVGVVFKRTSKLLNGAITSITGRMSYIWIVIIGGTLGMAGGLYVATRITIDKVKMLIGKTNLVKTMIGYLHFIGPSKRN